MKIKLMSMFLLLIGSVANAQKTIEELQAEIKQTHGIRIVRSTSDLSYVDDADFKFFLEAFLAEAEKQGLSEGDKKRFFPVRIRFKVYPENWNLFDSQVCYGCSDIAFNRNDLVIGHRSASGVVSFIIDHFPLEGTEEAAELELRNRAVRQAIMDKVQYAKEQGVKVRSCIFAVSCDLDNELDIAYSTQEQLLQGLINLEKSITTGDENRSEITIAPFVGLGVRLIWDGYYSYNRWIVDDESETKKIIFEYMERLRTDSA